MVTVLLTTMCYIIYKKQTLELVQYPHRSVDVTIPSVDFDLLIDEEERREPICVYPDVSISRGANALSTVLSPVVCDHKHTQRGRHGT